MSHYFSKVRWVARADRHDWFLDLLRHGEAYRDHALLWKLFPGDGVPRDFVFRSLAEPMAYYAVSTRLPQPLPGLFEVRSKSYQPQLMEGEWLRFDLRANPTVSLRTVTQGGNPRSRRHDVLMHAKSKVPEGGDIASAQETAGRDWLLQRAMTWGFEPVVEHLQQNAYRQHRLRHKGRSIEFSSLDYQGLARVTDPGLLSRALLNGVGHARGFGCGLLMVRRIT